MAPESFSETVHILRDSIRTSQIECEACAFRMGSAPSFSSRVSRSLRPTPWVRPRRAPKRSIPRHSNSKTFLLLDRLTFGATAAEAERLRAMGAARWLEAELHPSAQDNLPPQAQAEIAALTVTQKPMPALVRDFTDKAKAVRAIADLDLRVAAGKAYQQELNDLAKQAASREILRDLYSPSQLREVMTWFWFNHFNVHQYKADIRAMLADYEDTLRAHALGRFRDLLEATLRHPAMLRYLDNAQNAAGHINENYAREIMELHTMGVGSGYSQQDVEALAHILTGVGIDLSPNPPHLKPALQGQLVRTGLFEFNPARHDYSDKIFLGHKIKGRGFAEVEEALDLIARSPATARHISRELATYFVADTPPASLIDKMAKTFQRTDGDIAAVLRTMIEFAGVRRLGRPEIQGPRALCALRRAPCL